MALDQRLQSIREMLQADGYDIEEMERPENGSAFRVVALENACADCLVPKEVMQGIIAQSLGVSGGEVSVSYPAGSD